MAGTSARRHGVVIQGRVGVIAGTAPGHVWPVLAVQIQPFGDAFVKLVRMIIAPMVFGTVGLGIARPTDAKEVGLTGPLGYVFNLDGSSIDFTTAITSLAQAPNIPIIWSDYLLIPSVLLLTSNGAATVTGGGFIILAETLGMMNGNVPVAGMVLLWIDCLISEARGCSARPSQRSSWRAGKACWT